MSIRAKQKEPTKIRRRSFQRHRFTAGGHRLHQGTAKWPRCLCGLRQLRSRSQAWLGGFSKGKGSAVMSQSIHVYMRNLRDYLPATTYIYMHVYVYLNIYLYIIH